jgi:hypothetical protein
LYSREAGAGCRHAWQESTTSIGAISYLVIRAFEVVGGLSHNLFRLIHSSRVKTRAETFIHLPSTQFLCKTQQQPGFNNRENINLSDDDWSVFKRIAGNSTLRQTLATAIKDLNTASRRRGE